MSLIYNESKRVHQFFFLQRCPWTTPWIESSNLCTFTFHSFHFFFRLNFNSCVASSPALIKPIQENKFTCSCQSLRLAIYDVTTKQFCLAIILCFVLLFFNVHFSSSFYWDRKVFVMIYMVDVQASFTIQRLQLLLGGCCCCCCGTEYFVVVFSFQSTKRAFLFSLLLQAHPWSTGRDRASFAISWLSFPHCKTLCGDYCGVHYRLLLKLLFFNLHTSMALPPCHLQSLVRQHRPS